MIATEVIYIALLFAATTPGVLFTIPKGGKKLVVAAVHGLVFALVYQFTYKTVRRLAASMEGFYAPVYGTNPKNMLEAARVKRYIASSITPQKPSIVGSYTPPPPLSAPAAAANASWMKVLANVK